MIVRMNNTLIEVNDLRQFAELVVNFDEKGGRSLSQTNSITKRNNQANKSRRYNSRSSKTTILLTGHLAVVKIFWFGHRGLIKIQRRRSTHFILARKVGLTHIVTFSELLDVDSFETTRIWQSLRRKHFFV